MMPPISMNSALFLDIDGTLLDFARTPDTVVVPPDLPGVLASLQQQLAGALAFVSGRSLDSIDSLFAPFCPAAIGAHGAEIRDSEGLVMREPPLSSKVRDVFTGLAQRIPGLLLEDKNVALALHYRLAPEAKPVLEAAMEKHRRLFEAEHVSVLHGKLVFEARPHGIDKGTAVVRLARLKPFAGRVPLFGGDDTTDLDVLRILPDLGGYGFSVGRKLAGARQVMASPRAVRQWLAGLAAKGLTP